MKEKMFFFSKIFENRQTREMNQLKMFRKNPSRMIFHQFSFESSESYRVFNY